MNAQKVPRRVHLSSSTASEQEGAVEPVQTCANQQDDDAGRVSGSPYYLVVCVDDGEDEQREREGAKHAKR